MSKAINDDGRATISQAVIIWQHFYDVEPQDKVLDALARVAGGHYRQGYRTPDDLATYLIGTYVGRWSMMISAPTSMSIH